jgi:chemotaxis receptor (MCP) glutamine deamidase CheD
MAFRNETAAIPAAPDHIVALDHFEVLPGDGLLRAELDSSIIVCLYDAVHEAGGMVHLRILPSKHVSGEASDETLAADLMLLHSCLAKLRVLSPAARHWQARIVTHYGMDGILQPVGKGVLLSVCQSCRHSGVEIVQSDAEFGRPVQVAFRPAMGQLRKLA